MPFGECAMTEGRLLGKLMGGEADFLWVRMGGVGGRGLLLSASLLFDAVCILFYCLCVDGVVLIEYELLLVSGGFGVSG